MPQLISLLLASEADTGWLGRQIAARLQPGDVLALNGPLGAGKTRLAKAVAAGLGVPVDVVNSPTFTLIQEYAGRWPIRHCDVYRLKSPAEFPELGLDELFAADGIALIEWAERVSADLPGDYLEICLVPTGLTERRVMFTGHGPRGTALELDMAALKSQAPSPDQ